MLIIKINYPKNVKNKKISGYFAELLIIVRIQFIMCGLSCLLYAVMVIFRNAL
jgi:hypothetical protein